MSEHEHQWLHHDAPGVEPAHVRELLVVRPGGLAEVVRAVPALRLLRETFSASRISVVAGRAAGELLGACPFVDRVVKLEQPSEALLERFDIAISFADPSEPAVLDLADVRADLRAEWGEPGDARRGVLLPAWPERLDASSRMVRLAWLLGGSLPSTDAMALWPSLADRNGAARLVADSDRPIALLHMGAGSSNRRWPAAGWGRVIDLLDAIGLDVVVVGGPEDQRTTLRVLQEVRHAPRSVVGRTSVGELVGLLERSMLFIGTDSGPAALAGAVGVRSIIIGPGSALEHVARPGLVELVDAGACTTCGEHACDHGTRAACEVTLDQVLARVDLAANAELARWRRTQIS